MIGLQINRSRNVSTDYFGAGRGSLGVSGAHCGNRCFIPTLPAFTEAT